jgi:hypothetical protein
MTTETPYRRQEVLTVLSCKTAKNPKSWHLKARATFQTRDSNWFIPKRGESHIENGQYLCLIEKADKWATDTEGEDDWRFNWNIIQFNIEPQAEEPVAPTEEAKFEAMDTMPIRPSDTAIVLPQETQRDDHPHKRQSIEKQTQDTGKAKMLRMAVDVVIAQISQATEAISAPTVLKRIREYYLGLRAIPHWNEYDGVPSMSSDATGPPQNDGFGEFELLEGDHDPDRAADQIKDSE